MGKVEELEHLLTADESAKERAELPPDVWVAELRKYRAIKQEEIKMTTVARANVKKAKTNILKIKKQRESLEHQYVDLYEGLKELEETSAERILEGENLAKETKRVADKKAERDALAAAIELSKVREQKAADILYQKELDQATYDAKKLILSAFEKIDSLDKVVSKPPPEYDELADMHKKLGSLVAPFSKKEGAMFATEARIIGAAARTLRPFENNWKVLAQMRERYEKGYTDERLKL